MTPERAFYDLMAYGVDFRTAGGQPLDVQQVYLNSDTQRLVVELIEPLEPGFEDMPQPEEDESPQGDDALD